MNLKQLKNKLREKIHVTLRSEALRADPEAAYKAKDNFLKHFKGLDARLVVAGTMPIKHEMDPRPLMQAMEMLGHRLCLPITLEKATPLLFRAYKTGDVLKKGVWGIGVPDDHAPVIEPDLLICPLLAFDRMGRRLGYGGGYYDATIKQLRAKKHMMAVGFCYAAQEVEEIPSGHYDQRLDAIITEKEIILIDPQA